MLIEPPDFEWLMTDTSHCKVHPHAAVAKGGSIKKFTSPRMRMVYLSEYLLQKVPVLIAKKLLI